MPMSPYMRDLRALTGTRRLIVPSVSAIIRDGDRILLVHQRHDMRWSMLGGGVEPEDTPADAVVREVWEEVGLTVVPTRIHSVYGGPEFVVRYPNGDESQYIATFFECDVLAGTLRTDDDEIEAAAFFTLADAMQLDLAFWLRRLLPRLYERHEGAWFEPNAWSPPS